MDNIAGNRSQQTLEISRPDQILTWTEVNKIHRIRNGVYQKNGELVSLLTDFGRINPCYPDRYEDSESTITYTGAGRHGDQQLDPPNRALLSAINSGINVPLFNKLGPGRWQYLGKWRVVAAKYVFNEAESRMLWRFTLQKER